MIRSLALLVDTVDVLRDVLDPVVPLPPTSSIELVASPTHSINVTPTEPVPDHVMLGVTLLPATFIAYQTSTDALVPLATELARCHVFVPSLTFNAFVPKPTVPAIMMRALFADGVIAEVVSPILPNTFAVLAIVLCTM